MTKYFLLAASGWNDSIHSQIHHDLSVVVEGMPESDGSHAQPRGLAFPEWTLHRFQNILIGDRGYGFVNISIRVFQIFHDIGFALHRGWAIFLTSIGRGLFSQNSPT